MMEIIRTNHIYKSKAYSKASDCIRFVSANVTLIYREHFVDNI